MVSRHDLDRDSPVPLYRQLRSLLEAEIRSDLMPTDRMPSSRQLAVDVGVSRNIVNLAYQELVDEGYLQSRPRSGLVVNPQFRSLVQRNIMPDNEMRTVPPDWSRWLERVSPYPQRQFAVPASWDRYPFPFVGGQVDISTFPRRAWQRCLQEALDTAHIGYSLHDRPGIDDPLLVEAIANHVLPARGIYAKPEEIMIVSGSQQGLVLLTSVLTERGGTVAAEDPGYLEFYRAVAVGGSPVEPVEIDAEGIKVDRIPARAKVVYLTPSHQFPTNVTMPIARRHELLHLASRRDMMIIEDDYDSEYRYQGRLAPALKALDSAGRSIYVGSFSKYLAPGIRLGFLVGDEALLAELRVRMALQTRHPPGQLQRALALLIQSGEYASARSRRRRLLRRKWELLSALVDQLPGCVAQPTTGGTSIWVHGPHHLDSLQLARNALEHGVIFEPEANFRLDEDAVYHDFRLNFAAIRLGRIGQGVARLAAVIAEASSASSARP